MKLIGQTAFLLFLSTFLVAVSPSRTLGNPNSGQLEISKTPYAFSLAAESATNLRIGILARDRLNNPAINGMRLINELPAGAVFLLRPGGEAYFSYSDSYLRTYRGRRQQFDRQTMAMPEEGAERTEDLLNHSPSSPRPKVMRDAHRLNVEALYFNEFEDTLWWSGEIIYKFDFGLPVKAFKLSSPDGTLTTRVGAWNGDGRYVRIDASSDGRNWVSVWRSRGNHDAAEVDAVLARSLLGRGKVYLRFRGNDTALHELHISAVLDSSGLEPQPAPQLDRTIAMQRELQRIGAGEIHIEGTGPFGLSTGGVGFEVIRYGGPGERKEAERMFSETIGREYGFYRFVSDAPIEPDSYYRALASKGILAPFDLRVLEELTPLALERIAQANRDYLSVLPFMKRRHLLGDGDSWKGVSWDGERGRNRVVFAFTTFHFPFKGNATIEDVTSGNRFRAVNGFRTEPMHTYRITY